MTAAADLAAWVAARTMLDAIAPHANQARAAAERAAKLGANPYDLEYARRLSHLLDAERDRLAGLVRRLADAAGAYPPPLAQGRQDGP
ncbi:hypothetical protein [Falsiroseomonas tokyonensis]|uniref:Uncharacterized protein n=1 Tax=Falsiroseomonas tokyonensis TaxID=430521 RepID=A0ABV7C186_9PROT|nr:hypothetical protein [Falsiroseomonas tokyonensis]MBU8540829.1 hypothetical protein [Falsiroseomonas tokyonensis]